MEQKVRFCAAPDGTRIAYASAGSGPVLVVCQGWISHVELDWANPASRHFWETLGECFTVVRYDKRGTGLSDRNVEDFSFASQLGDLCAVVDAVHAPRIALMGYSQGGPLSIAYAAANPDRVSHLVLYGTYASGSYGAITELAVALIRLIELDWGGLGSLAMADIYMPGAPTEYREQFADYQQRCADRNVAAFQARCVAEFKVKHLLKDVVAPALVLHKRGDKAVPFELGRRLARDLPDSRLVVLEGDSHILTLGSVHETLDAILGFLSSPANSSGSTTGGMTRREAEVLRLLAGGKSNRSIAQTLQISVNTVDRHVSHVYAKIGASNRAEAATYAVRSGLVN